MKSFIDAVFLLITFLVFSQAAYACMCIPPKNPYKTSKAVFFGELVEIAATDSRTPRALKFKVERYWKGVKDESINVMTTPATPCGYNFSLGERYLIYAGEQNGQLETAPCRILYVDSAEKDLKKLGKGKVPRQTSVSSTAPPNKQALLCNAQGVGGSCAALMPVNMRHDTKTNPECDPLRPVALLRIWFS